MVSAERLRLAATGFAAAGDVDAELAAHLRERRDQDVANDMADCSRCTSGSRIGRRRVGSGPIARRGRVRPPSRTSSVTPRACSTPSTRAPIGPRLGAHVQWLRSVAYRARRRSPCRAPGARCLVEHGHPSTPQLEVARLRIQWLEGEVDRAAEALSRTTSGSSRQATGSSSGRRRSRRPPGWRGWATPSGRRTLLGDRRRCPMSERPRDGAPRHRSRVGGRGDARRRPGRGGAAGRVARRAGGDR